MTATSCRLLAFVALSFTASSAICQDFGGQQVITTDADGAQTVYATDLDGDGDADVLSASFADDKVAWYENLGGGAFGPQRVITTAADQVRSAFATDLDGDGDSDVLSASEGDNKIAWYKNLGGGSFGPQQVITTSTDHPTWVFAADLDGDDDADVLSTSAFDNKVAWYENLGGGSFGPQQIVGTGNRPLSVYAADLDGDNDLDVLSASAFDDKIAWYENLGGGVFGPQQVITTEADAAQSVHAEDLDGDGDVDVLSASNFDDKIAWYENLGGGDFGPQQVITTLADGANAVYAIDLDDDGDADVLSASWFDNKVAWYENLGGGSFGQQQVIMAATNSAPGSVYAADLDGDGDAEVISASGDDDKIAWHENLMGPFGWLQSPVNGHWHKRLAPMPWINAEAQSQVYGGHLATVRSQSENDWLRDTFAATEPVWIGYTDQDQEGVFEWASGEPVGYENWRAGEPDDFLGADWALIEPIEGVWLDEPYLPEHYGVVEVISDDCNDNHIPDTLEIAQDVLLDWNGDGVLDECTPPTYCSANPNSTGLGASISVMGTPLITDNDFTLHATDVAANQFGYFLMSETQDFVPMFGGSEGNLCLGAPIRRIKEFPGQVVFSGPLGVMTLQLDLQSELPPPVVLTPGDTWHFQLWFRDVVNSTFTSNTSDGITVMFR